MQLYVFCFKYDNIELGSKKSIIMTNPFYISYNLYQTLIINQIHQKMNLYLKFQRIIGPSFQYK